MKIGEIDYKVVSGYGTVVKYCRSQKLEFHEFLEIFSGVDADKLTNDLFVHLAGFTATMIERGGEEPPDLYDIIDWLGKGGAGEVIELLFEGLSLPKNLEATGKGR